MAESLPDYHDKPNDNDEAIKDWTQEEKFHLLQALKNFGPNDTEKIQGHVMTKNLEQTKAAVEYYTGIALQHPLFKKAMGEKPKSSRKSRVPLTDWAKLLTDNVPYNELCTETATAVRMIADLEDIPPPECTENIDFRQVYHQIANAMEGKPINPDPGVAAVLEKCIIETALSSKAFIKPAVLKNILKNVDLSHQQLNSFPRPTNDHELAILRHLASQRSYNPLRIPEEHLQPALPSEIMPKPKPKPKP